MCITKPDALLNFANHYVCAFAGVPKLVMSTVQYGVKKLSCVFESFQASFGSGQGSPVSLIPETKSHLDKGLQGCNVTCQVQHIKTLVEPGKQGRN